MITERLMKLGTWTVPLKQGIPENVLGAIDCFDSIVITNQWLNLDDGWTDSQILDAAIYTGMIRVLPRGDQSVLEGIGNLGWFGDENNRGQILTAAYTPGTQTHAGWWTGLTGTIESIASPLTAGTLNTVTRGDALELEDSFQYVNRRNVADAVASFYEAEYRVNHDFTIDAGTAAQLFATTPTAVLVRRASGKDLELSGINIDQATLRRDVIEYTTKVVAQGKGVTGSDSITSSYKDPQNSAVQRHILVNVQTDVAAAAGVYAESVLADLDDITNTVTISTRDYDSEGAFTVGDTVYIYDPEAGLIDASTQKQFRGEVVFPTTIRVVGSSWPVVSGMGVYTRTGAGVLTDITRFVEWESDTSATLEVGSLPRSTVAPIATGAGHTHAQYPIAIGYTDWTPSYNNLTVGNGSVEARYVQIGKLVHAWYELTFGSTTSIDGSNPTISLPVNASASYTTVRTFLGQAYLFETGVGQADGKTRLQSTSTISVGVDLASGTYVAQSNISATVPFAWGTGDVLTWRATYEAA